MRRLAVLVYGLPATAQTWRDDTGGWSLTDRLLATLIQVDHGHYAAWVATKQWKTPPSVEPPSIYSPVGASQRRKKKTPWVRELARRASGR